MLTRREEGKSMHKSVKTIMKEEEEENRREDRDESKRRFYTGTSLHKSKSLHMDMGRIQEMKPVSNDSHSGEIPTRSFSGPLPTTSSMTRVGDVSDGQGDKNIASNEKIVQIAAISAPAKVIAENSDELPTSAKGMPRFIKKSGFVHQQPGLVPSSKEGLNRADTQSLTPPPRDKTPGRNPHIERLLHGSLRSSYGGNFMEAPNTHILLPVIPDYQLVGDRSSSSPSSPGSTEPRGISYSYASSPRPQENSNSYSNSPRQQGTPNSFASSPLPPWRMPPDNSNRIVANTIFTGGFRNDPRGHIMMTDNHGSSQKGPLLDPKVGPRSARCSRYGCDELVMRDSYGNEHYPCLCQYGICGDCYKEEKEDTGACPGCKEKYPTHNPFDSDDEDGNNEEECDNGKSNDDRKSIGGLSREDVPLAQIGAHFGRYGNDGQARRNPGSVSSDLSVDGYEGTTTADNQASSDVDAGRTQLAGENAPLAIVLTEERDSQMLIYGDSKAQYGYGSAVWPKADCETSGGGGGGGGVGNGDNDGEDYALLLPRFDERANRPLCRKVPVSLAVISPYRLMIVIRLAVLVLFLRWRFLNPSPDAEWLWMASVICETWFGFSWILDQFPKMNPVNRRSDLDVLREKFEGNSVNNGNTPASAVEYEGTSASNGKAPASAVQFLHSSHLPGIDTFVSTADPEKEPVLTTANTVLSILAANYPVERIACYVSDDGASLLTFEALTETAKFARAWIPFCRKYNIEPRCPEYYFHQRKEDRTKGQVGSFFLRERRRMKREYDEFKVRINGLPDVIRRRSDDLNVREELRCRRAELGIEPALDVKPDKATWMCDGSKWPGTWDVPHKDHWRNDHSGIIQVLLTPPEKDPSKVQHDCPDFLDVSGVDTRLPLLVYVSREKRPGYDHNKKAGAMNALIRTSAVMSNGAFILNLDCDHYVNNSDAMREAMCFMMGRGGDKICFVQFPQRFEGIDPNDRYANNNTVFFDINMRGLDGIQGPFYAGTGCVFRRTALYGMYPPNKKNKEGTESGCCRALLCCCNSRKKQLASQGRKQGTHSMTVSNGHCEQLVINPTGESIGLLVEDNNDRLLAQQFGPSQTFLKTIAEAEEAGMPLGKGHRGLVDENGRKEDSCNGNESKVHEQLDPEIVAEGVNVISSWYEEKTEWGKRIGWIYGSVTEDVVTGYRMHNRGWKSAYAHPNRPAFKGTAPINLTDRLHQVLRWATGSVEIFFSRNNALVASNGLKCLQRVAYLNVGIYPFTSIFLTVYCFLPAICLLSDKFITPTPISLEALVYIFALAVTTYALAVMEVRWSGVTLEEWWRNEQFWVIGGTSAHLAAVYQGLLKVTAGVDISFTLTSKSAESEDGDPYADLHHVKWTSLMVPPLTIMIMNIFASVLGIARTVYTPYPRWSDLLGKLFFSFWVLIHMYPFAKGLMGRRNRTPTILFVWAGLLSIVLSLIWTNLSPPEGSQDILDNSFQFP